jgi:hypothetical protein
LHRYGNIEYVMDLSVYRAAAVVAKAREEERKDKVFRLYLADKPYFKDPMSFEDYYEQVCPAPVVYDHRDKDVLMAEILKEVPGNGAIPPVR